MGSFGGHGTPGKIGSHQTRTVLAAAYHDGTSRTAAILEVAIGLRPRVRRDCTAATKGRADKQEDQQECLRQEMLLRNHGPERACIPVGASGHFEGTFFRLRA